MRRQRFAGLDDNGGRRWSGSHRRGHGRSSGRPLRNDSRLYRFQVFGRRPGWHRRARRARGAQLVDHPFWRRQQRTWRRGFFRRGHLRPGRLDSIHFRWRAGSSNGRCRGGGCGRPCNGGRSRRHWSRNGGRLPLELLTNGIRAEQQCFCRRGSGHDGQFERQAGGTAGEVLEKGNHRLWPASSSRWMNSRYVFRRYSGSARRSASLQ
jgi:hypothetical protein